MAIEIEVQSPYGTKIGAGPIITGRNWRSSPRMNKIGAFSFEMPLNDPRRSYLVQKRYVRCYGMVNGTRTELGKPGIIDSVVKEMDANGVPTGMLRVSGRDLLAELADINIHELGIIDTDTRSPDRMEYYDGTAEIYVPTGSGAHMEYAYDGNGETGVQVASDDEDYLYVGDDAPFDIINYTIADGLNTDSTSQSVAYWNGSSWASGTILSDSTKASGATWGQNGSIRWERQEDWATTAVNGQTHYWLRFNFGEDLSTNVTIYETTVTQEIPTATALADWLAYTDAAAGTPISDLGWDFEATHTATENAVFLKLRDVSAFEALALIGEQAGENFRLGTGRLIEWLQDDKTASGIRATNVSDGIAAQDNEDICLITNLRETEDSYEVVSRVYPQGGGRGATRITLSQCTEAAPEGYTLSKTANYLLKDSVEEAVPTGYGRRIEMTKFWPNVVSPNWASSRDANSSNALYKLAYEYLSRHWEPQTSYQFSVVKLDAEVKVGETIQVCYWQTVEGTAVWDLGIATALHLWVLEVTQAIDDIGVRVVAMQVATIDAWPPSHASKVRDAVKQIKSLQSTDAPVSAENLTISTFQTFVEGATAHSQLTGVTADQHHPQAHTLASHSTKAHAELTDVSEAQHHNPVTAGTLISLSTQQVSLAVGSAQYQAPVTGADPFTPAWTALSTYAGAGLAWTSNAYAVGAGNGIAVAADSIAVDLVAAWSGLEFSDADLRINLAAAFTWTAKHIFRSTTTPQVEIGYDAAAYLSITQADGGSVTLATVSDGAGSMILAPQGDVLFDPTGNDLLPVTGYDLNLGSLAKKYLTLHCAELWVETLVAQDTIATIGGRILVGPTTVLTADLGSADIVMWVKHNEMAKNDHGYLEAQGKVEFIWVIPLTIQDVDVDNDWFLRNGDWRAYFTTGTKFTVAGSTGNDGEWTVESSSYSDPNTTINVVEDITDATVDGYFLYWGEQGVGPFGYVIARNRDGSGANDWYAGDAVFNTGNTGDGFIDLYSVHGIKAPTEYGPTIVINKRGSTTYNDWTPHAALGNLNGIAGIAATAWGLFVGDYAGGDYLLYQAGGDPDFLIKAGGGVLSIDDDGVTIEAGGSYSNATSYQFKDDAGVRIACLGAYFVPTGAYSQLTVPERAGKVSAAVIATYAPANYLAASTLYAKSGATVAQLGCFADSDASPASLIDIEASVITLDGDVTAEHGLNVGTATGAGTGAIRASDRLSLGNYPTAFQNTYYVASVAADATANVVAMTTNQMMTFLIVSWTLGGNIRGATFMVMGETAYEIDDPAGGASGVKDTDNQINLYIEGGYLVAQNTNAGTASAIYVQLIGQNN